MKRNDMANALTFDVEDWYMGIEIGMENWGAFEKRLEIGLGKILDILSESGVKATFFVLGRCAEEHPALIRRIAEEGHETATHGYSHTKVYDMTPETFEAELVCSIRALKEATGCDVLGHRAPYFSVTKETPWAFEIMARNGLRYDCSVYPGSNYRYGIEGAPECPHIVEGCGLAEFPVSVLKMAGRKAGLGGAYFRILPYAMTRLGIRRLNAKGQPAVFYLHPWEFDPAHPRVSFRRKAMFTHYFMLNKTEARFRRLLRDFRFTTVSDALAIMDLRRSTE